MDKLAGHFRVEVTHDQAEIFLDHLIAWSDYQIDIAFKHCIVECMFFPKLKEVLDRMPAARSGPTQLCARCEPDGWVLVPKPNPTEGNWAVRCDHTTNYSPPHDLKPLYKEPPAWVHNTEKKKATPRWPHLAGKGILYD